MNKDLIYKCDIKTKVVSVLGEIQKDFNMSFVIDGTKDSTKLIVISYEQYELTANTLLWHEMTNTYWIVSKDKVERHLNDSGFIYVHNLDLVGAVELLNARDLVDCGFNDNTYTVSDFIKRLFKLSNFEFSGSTLIINAPDGFLDKKVEFIQTYQNYTLLSALREFLNAYNMCAKLTFNISIQNKLNQCYLDIYSKAGDPSLPQHNMSDFNDVRETRTTNVNSYGASVITNAENTISSVSKIFPASGAATFSSNEYTITFDNAVLRLPTNVYKINSLKMVMATVNMSITYTDAGPVPIIRTVVIHFDDYNANSENYDAMLNDVPGMSDANKQYLIDNKEYFIREAMQYCYITFYDGVRYNPNDTFSVTSKTPYVPIFKKDSSSSIRVIICDKNTKNNMRNKAQGIAWERGSNIISGFEFLNEYNRLYSMAYTDGGYRHNNSEIIYNGNTMSVTTDDQSKEFALNPFVITETYNYTKHACLFIVDYIPMADLKIKYDNRVDKNDIQLYNQNGKLTDCVAFSKLLNSYSKEISSETITRYKTYYSDYVLPLVGSIVKDGNVSYVINNISMNFTQNENTSENYFGYYVECEITMSKWVSTKSLMVNPNTNIRDYGIPQYFNVKRKQLYRDYYELDFSYDTSANADTPYLVPTKVFNFDAEKPDDLNMVCFIGITYAKEVDGSYYWYYQLETTNYYMAKQFIVMCDFNDNNIIGYSQQNGSFVFNVQNLFNQNLLINTPISYVDDDGCFSGINILFIDNDKRQTIDNTYFDDNNIVFGSIDGRKEYDPLTTQVWIPWQLYDIAYENDEYDFEIQEPNYNKDALEVPVFEYCCQVDDSDNVLIGDYILFSKSHNYCFYTFVLGDDIDVSTATNTTVLNHPDGVTYAHQNYAHMTITQESGKYILSIDLYQAYAYFTYDNTAAFDGVVTIPTNKDIAIFRMYIDKNGVQQNELVMIIKKGNISQAIQNNSIKLKLNYYKLK